MTNTTIPLASQQTFKCPICKDSGLVRVEVMVDGELRKMDKQCECMLLKAKEKVVKSSKITEGFRRKVFANFERKGMSKDVAGMYQLACYYATRFDEIREREANWLVLTGNSGCGKTHLAMGIANQLLDNGLVDVLYFPHAEGVREFLNTMKQDDFPKRWEMVQKAGLLVWDDLFKPLGVEVGAFEKKMVFEILNYRYLNFLPTIITSERRIAEFIGIDEATGGRINERSRGLRCYVEGKENNYRLRD